MRRYHYLVSSLRTGKVTNERQGCHKQEGQCRQQCYLIGWLKNFDIENPFKRGKDECSGHESGYERIDNNKNAPLKVYLIREYITLYMRKGVVKILVLRIHIILPPI